MSEEQKVVTNRRNFLKFASVGAVGLASGSMMQASVASPRKWDVVTDVIVLGYGAAGAATAITAADNGCQVVIVERQPEKTCRPNSRMSGGIFHCPDKTADRKALKQYAQAMFSGENIPGKLEGEQPEFSEELAEAWAEYTPKLLDWLREQDPAIKGHATAGYKGAAFPDFPGAKDCAYQVYRASYLDRIPPVCAYGKPKLETSNGEAFWQCLVTGVTRRKSIRVMFELKGEHLIKNDNGEVIGMTAIDKEGKTVNLKCRKAVVLCSGGYEYSKQMRQAFLEGPGVEGWAFYGTLYNEGDGIRMGQEVGAGLQKVGKAAARLIMPAPERFNGMRIGMESPSVGSGHSIVVNAYGKRYGAENKITDDPSRYFFYKEGVHFDINRLEYPNSPSWMIFDEKLRTSRSIVALNMSTAGYGFVDWGAADNSDAIRKGWILKGDTVEELGEKIAKVQENGGRMDPKVLAETVQRYNKFCAEKKDADFGRKLKSLQPVDQGPFYAVPLVAGGPNTKGGLACNGKREVLDWTFKPIPRLYAVGEIASALKYVYQGGGNLTECVVFGQVAGKNVAKLKNLD